MFSDHVVIGWENIMALRLFYELEEEKREKIIQTALCEFAEYGFGEGSTNRIVKKAGISKGSLFKYFSSKQELYTDVLDIVIENYTGYLEENIKELPEDAYGRVVRLARAEFSWYASHPDYYRLFKKAFMESPGKYIQSMDKYAQKASEIFYGLFSAQKPGAEESKKLDILKWFLEGFNREFIEKADINGDISKLEEAYVRELEGYIEILRKQ